MDRYVRRIDARARARLGAEPWWRIAERYGIVSIQTRPEPALDGGRPRGFADPLPSAAMSAVVEHCEPGADVQLIISRGRTDSAARRALPVILPDLLDGCATRGLSVGRPIALRPYRLGVVEAITRALAPRAVVLITMSPCACALAAQMSALVAVQPAWDALPACRVRLSSEPRRRADPRHRIPGAGDSQTMRLMLDVVYALAASPGRPAGSAIDAVTHGREADRPQWNPDGLPEAGR